MTEGESLFRIASAALTLTGLGIRLYYQRQFRAVQRDAPRGRQRDKVYYYLVLGSFLLVLVYAASTVMDFAHLPFPAAARWAGAIMVVASVALLIACHQAL